MADLIPESRRAEGFGYWGMASVLAIALAPSLGLWLFRYGWHWICLLMGLLALGMFAIAWRIPQTHSGGRPGFQGLFSASLVERKVFALSVTLFLYSFGYGGVTSFVALYSKESGVQPNGLFFIVFSITILVTRPFVGRVADHYGRKRVFVPCLVFIAIGLAALACSRNLSLLVLSAVLYGIGFGSAYPAFTAYVIETGDTLRRGAIFGTILLAFDTGIGSGSILLGFVIQHHGYARAFWLGSLLSACAIPYFYFVDQRLSRSLQQGGC